MWTEVQLREDTTTLYVTWEIGPEGGELARLERLAGPLVLRIAASHYVDEGGKYFEHTDVDVPIFPHAGRANRGQAKFRDYESRRRFVENLQDGVTRDVADYLWSVDPTSLPVEGHVVVRPEGVPRSEGAEA
jgi:hypothetical protein